MSRQMRHTDLGIDYRGDGKIDVEVVGGGVAITQSLIDIPGIEVAEGGDVLAGQQETVDIIPPIGYAYKVHTLFLSMPRPGGSTSGIHEITCRSGAVLYGWLRDQKAHNIAILFDMGYFKNASLVVDPATALEQRQAMTKITGTNGRPIRFIYANTSDVTASTIRQYQVIVDKIRLGTP